MMEENKQEIELTEEQKKDLLKVLLKRTLEDSKSESVDIPKKIELLKTLKISYETEYDFQIGDILRWKRQLKNRKFPEYNEPIILLEILENPIINTNEQIGSTYFNEKIDIRAGIIKDNALLTFYLESKRFEIYN